MPSTKEAPVGLTKEQLIEELLRLGVKIGGSPEPQEQSIRQLLVDKWSNREHRYGSKKCEETPYGPFRVLRGTHSEGYEVEDGQCTSLRFYKGAPHGDILYSRSDLVRKFNSPGSEKFALVHVDEKPITAKDINEKDERLAGYDHMTKEELVKHAEQEEINLEGATTKDQIVKRIKNAL